MTINTISVPPLDTIKETTFRMAEMLDHLVDHLGSNYEDVSEYVYESLDSIRALMVDALGQHVPVRKDPVYGVLDQFSYQAYVFEDGTPVLENMDIDGYTSTYYPRSSGDREVFIERLTNAAADYRANQQRHNLSIVEDK